MKRMWREKVIIIKKFCNNYIINILYNSLEFKSTSFPIPIFKLKQVVYLCIFYKF